MKKFSKVIFLSFINFCNLFSQVEVNEIINSNGGLLLNLSFKEEAFVLEGEYKNIINYSAGIDESKAGLPILPSKTIFIAVPPESKIDINIIKEKTNLITNVIPKANPEISLSSDSTLNYTEGKLELSLNTGDFYPQEKFIIEGYIWLRSFYCAVVRFNTHRYDWQNRQLTELTQAAIKLKFFDEKPFIANTSQLDEFEMLLEKVIINFNEAKNFRSFPPASAFNDSTGNWIDYSKEYVKLQIPNNGIYRISYDDALSFGIPQSVNPKTFKIYYEGKELSLFVSGETDNSFDPGDYIEFWGEKNYRRVNYRNLVSQGEEYLTYMDIYSDTSIVWLTWDGNNGRRAEIVSDYVAGLTDSVTSHLVKIHLERDALLWYYGFYLPRIQLPFWHECKTWVWQQVTSSGTNSYPFTASSIVPNTPVYTLSRLNSWATTAGLVTNAHKYGALLNSTGIQDSIIFDFETIANLEAVFSSNELIEGANNYKISGMPNDSGYSHRALVDWIDLEYYQFTNAVNDSILITVPDSVSPNLRVVKIGNYNTAVDSTIIYKIESAAKRISAYQISSSILTFTDSVSGGDKYIVLKQSYIKKPIFLKKKQFVNLRDQNRQADYLLVAHGSLQASGNDYVNFIESNYSGAGNFNAEMVLVEDIYDEFGYGYQQPEPVKEFLKYAFFGWQTPKPVYLTLLGDCTYDYKNLFGINPPLRKYIFVPSYGNPVSDIWFTMWDTANVNVQQMLVGRIPANNNDEVYSYLDKHQTYVQREFDEWNKNFLLFSGGFPEYPSEMEQIKQANNRVLTNVIEPSPVGGEAIHFYKTITPPTNLGPYSAEEIKKALDYGGLFISYVGHSGTRTWDNGVTEPEDIENAFEDRLPLVSDNGCSTGKYAEPDIDAFGELFLNQDPSGQAIAYLGNSSLGYTSTSFRMPEVFYKRLVADTILNIGEAHFLSKMDNFNQAGFSDVNRLFNYCNILLGDPIIKFAFPDKPNFVANQNSIEFSDEFITDTKDSLDIKFVLSNWGRVVEDSLQVDIEGIYSDSTIYSLFFLNRSPYFRDTLAIKIPILGLAGEHRIKVELDKSNMIDEINELDNSVEIRFIIYSTKIRPLEAEYFYNSSRNSGELLNPTIRLSDDVNEIELALSENPDFSNQSLFIRQLDSVATKFTFNNLSSERRYYWRARLKNANEEWSQTISFLNSQSHSWFMSDSFNPEDVTPKKVKFDSTTQSWKIIQGINNLKISSAGFNDGKYASIQYNFLEYVSNTFFRGFATALIDTFDLHPFDVQTFKTPVTPSRDSLINYLNYLEEGSVFAIAATDEVSTFFSGTVGDSLQLLLRGFGSVYVDSIGWRDSWAMIGIKGAPQGTVPEAFSKSLQGPAIIDTSKFVQFTEGSIQFPPVTNSIKWLNVIKDDSIPSGALINYYPLAYNNDGSIDTLISLSFNGNEASVEFINAENYRKIALLAELEANSNSESPELRSLAVNFVPPPELAINYQVVSVSPDSVLIGENIKLNFFVYNVGKTTADSFKVKVELIQPDNSRNTVMNEFVNSLLPGDKKYFEYTYNTSEGAGSKAFEISIDPDKKVYEFFEDNNFFNIPFYVKPDTTTPTIVLTIDGSDILNGEYISAEPTIHIELTDQSLLPIADPNAVLVYLNDELIPFDTSIINYQFSETNPKVVVDFIPKLSDGEYYLRVLWRDSQGNIVDSSGVKKFFLVSDEAKLLNVYNYPNPSQGETHFTFKLTQIPEEIRIKIFT
ncbi:MAG: hypothetical protein HXY48_01305, partial [Ignavibacteriaceae bacterium]|nr:hypothetical protein [Ignavibacteriaceae bacterium]